MKIIAYKGRPVSVFVDEFVSRFALLQLYSNHRVLSFRNIEVESYDGSHLESLDALGPGKRMLKNVHSLVFGQTVTKYSSIFLPNFNEYFVEFMQQKRPNIIF